MPQLSADTKSAPATQCAAGLVAELCGTFVLCCVVQLEAAAAAAREEKRKGEAALEAAEARFAAREALAKEEWQR